MTDRPNAGGADTAVGPTPGYYPDPSVPGFVRYWGGASWVPGTSRPAPAEGEVLEPPRFVARPRPSVAARYVPPPVVPERERPQAGPGAEAGAGPGAVSAEGRDGWSAGGGEPAPGQAPGGGEPGAGDTGPFYFDQTTGGASFSIAPHVAQELRLRSSGAGADAGGEPVPGPAGESVTTGWQADPRAQRGLLETGGSQRWVSWGVLPGSAGEGGGGGGTGPVAGTAAVPADAPGTEIGAGAGAGADTDTGAGAARPAVTLPEPVDADTDVDVDGTGEAVPGSGRASGPAAAGAAPGTGGPAGAARPVRADAFEETPVPLRAAAPTRGAGPMRGPVPGREAAPATARTGAAARVEAPVGAKATARARGAAPVAAPASATASDTARRPASAKAAAASPASARTRPAVRRRPAPSPPAGLGRRLFARLVDTAVLAVVGMAAGVPLVGSAAEHVDEKLTRARIASRLTRQEVQVWLVDGVVLGKVAVLLGILVFVAALYEVVPTARTGQTFGKRLARIRVVDARAGLGRGPLGLGRSLLRWVVRLFGAVLLVGLCWPLFDRPARRGWQDRAAGTRVVRG